MSDHSNKLDENSESTMIVDTNILKRVRQSRQGALQAYLIVLSGPEVGQMHKLDEPTITLGRSQDTEFRINDVGVSRRHARILHRPDGVYLEDLKSINGTYLNGDRVHQTLQLRDGDKITLGSTTILKFTYHDKLDESFQQKMFDAALRDSLTGAYNKRYFLDHIRSEFAFAARHSSDLSLVMFDIDHFKQVNDLHGHLAGDAVIVRVAELSEASVRSEDLFARYGGEEFAILCRGISMKQAAHLGERLRRSVEASVVTHRGTDIGVTVSVGVASFPEVPLHSAEDLIEAADAALYGAKNNGRNRVMLAALAR